MEQLLGARSWIEKYPNRISLDAKCTKPFPLEITITPETRFHLIAIAHGSSEQCKNYFSGGNGGLIIDSRIIGDMHTDDNCKPFGIGKVDEDPQNFVHVFDDVSYATVLRELDTIKDFINYLDNRKMLLLSKNIIAPSENDILAQHLAGLIEGNTKLFQELAQNDYTDIYFEEGFGDSLINSPEYANWRKSFEKSYFWDDLLQKTFYFIENGLSAQTTTPTIQDQSFCFVNWHEKIGLIAMHLLIPFYRFCPACHTIIVVPE